MLFSFRSFFFYTFYCTFVFFSLRRNTIDHDDMSSDVNSTGTENVEDWTPEDVTLLVLYCCASIVGTTANIFVMTAIASQSSRSRNSLILSLCASDLLVCTVSMPLALTTVLVDFWTMGLAFCKVAFYFQVTRAFFRP